MPPTTPPTTPKPRVIIPTYDFNEFTVTTLDGSSSAKQENQERNSTFSRMVNLKKRPTIGSLLIPSIDLETHHADHHDEHPHIPHHYERPSILERMNEDMNENMSGEKEAEFWFDRLN